MKKLPIEEKAKRYDEAIERARAIFYQGSYKPNTAATIAETLQSVFPELKESEDERIRKWLIAQLKIKSCNDNSRELEDMINKSIAWLEKQGEIDKASYEIAEKEKQEFVGDGFIKCYADFQDFKEGETYWLEYLGNDNYNVRSDNLLGKTYHITPCQLYTIFKKQTYLEKQDEHKPADKVELNFKVGDKIRKKSPSSFDKDMEVARIEKDYYVCNHIGKFSSEVVPFSEESYYELIEQKPAWSEEDKDFMYDTLSNLTELKDRYGEGYGNVGKCIDWLKSLKERVQPQPQQEWSEEDEKFFKTALWHISYSISNGKSTDIHCDTTEWFKSLKDRVRTKQDWSEEDEKIIKRIDSLLYSKCKIHESEHEEIHNWLKSLKDRVGCEVNCTTKQEWSKEDEKILKDIITDVKFEGYNNDMQANSYKKINWLKSLRPQNTWKPSEEQLEVLREALAHIPSLTEIYEQLKKLKGE